MPIKINYLDKASRKLRICLFGRDSSGKTHFGLSSPGPVLVADEEGRVASMSDTFGPIPAIQMDPKHPWTDVLEAARAVAAGTLNDAKGKPFGSFLVDSWTVIEKSFEAASGLDLSSGNLLARREAQAALRKRLELELLNPMLTGVTKAHMIFTAHEANVWNPDAKGVIGKRPDATRNFAHYFDLVFHMERDGQRRTATVVKSNYQHILPIGTKIENLSWAHDAFAKILESDIVPVPISELVALHAQAGSPEGSFGKWLVANDFPVDENKRLAPNDTHRAKGVLTTLIEDRAEDALEVPA